jgi:dienelactone hydrolase
LFEYFPDEPNWNMSIALALQGPGIIHEIDSVCQSLKNSTERGTDNAQTSWLEKWVNLSNRLEGLAKIDEEAGNYLSAGRKFLSAANYCFIAERQVNYKNPQKVEIYKKGLSLFKKGINLRNEPVEFVEVPYKNTSLPALFIPAKSNKKSPCMVHFDGADGIKEVLYFANLYEYRERGISLLIVDHPGVGESLRLRNMYTGPEVEIPASACVDYLETRPDVDPDKIGIMALSLGGYYAPRAAAFEKRFKCCVAWGATWSFSYVVEQLVTPEMRGDHLLNFQFAWITGQKTLEDTLAVARKMTLEGIADKITCPFLVVHGEKDRLIPISIAQKTIDAAVNCPVKKLKIFTSAEGGVDHCQVDNVALVREYISDWVAEILGGDTKGKL